jgi:hypothetical protein
MDSTGLHPKDYLWYAFRVWVWVRVRVQVRLRNGVCVHRVRVRLGFVTKCHIL